MDNLGINGHNLDGSIEEERNQPLIGAVLSEDDTILIFPYIDRENTPCLVVPREYA